MTEDSYSGADRADGGDVSRLLLIALAMIAAGVGLWRWDDRRDTGQNLAKPHLTLPVKADSSSTPAG